MGVLAVCAPPVISTPAFDPRLSNVSDPPAPGVSARLFEFETTIVPIVIGASSEMVLADVGEVRKFAVTPAPFGTCLGAAQLPAEFQLPPPAKFQVEPKFAAPAIK